MFSQSEALHVFKYKGSGFQFGHNAHEIAYQLVSRIVQGALADQRETLARCTAKDAIDGTTVDGGGLSNLVAREPLDRTCKQGRPRKIVLVHGAMNWIDFNRRGDVKASLFEPEA